MARKIEIGYWLLMLGLVVGVVGFTLANDKVDSVPNQPKVAKDEASPYHPKSEMWEQLLSKAKYKVTILTMYPATNGQTLTIELTKVGRPEDPVEFRRVYDRAMTLIRCPLRQKGKHGYIYIPKHAIAGLKIELISSLHDKKKS